ncbi:AAA family ATPase [Tenacibaculum sp. 1_MG-2023]|uniref:AAA family ATPase n=1 Tax=Tenacibaculum sp. 1_MG-2023 TaxID=3062653 RepID=UPI0026E1B58D|nr:AAA family ATPase [Tenacibaculum sp. 1_MG-2023]MDO6674003.1 AAA family ATPase [Tenacibaculum sp. 1_MG-2023]
MIKKIKEIENFGIFESISNQSNYLEFNRFNLFYGHNGSGKSTLSHLFSLLESKDIQTRFPDSKWGFHIDDTTILSNLNDIDNELNIKVFDKGFMERNINWNKVIKGILVVSEDKKIEIQQRDNKIKEEKGIKSSIEKLTLVLEGDGKSKGEKGLVKDNSSFLSEAARNIKQKFQLIEVDDTYLSNYNKTKLENRLKEKQLDIQKPQMNVSEIEKLAQTIKPQDKDIINKPDLSKLEQVDKAYDRINLILESTVASKVIDILKDSPEKSEWVKKGLDIHKENEECSFCGNQITDKRIEELNSYFSDSYRNIIEQIDSVIKWIEDFEYPYIPSQNSFYKEYQKDYKKFFDFIHDELKKLELVKSDWKQLLETKRKDPFKIIEGKLLVFDSTLILKYFGEIDSLISYHNDKFKNADSIIKKTKINLELEYIKEELKRYDYYKKSKEEINKLNEQEILKEKNKEIEVEIKQLNKKISTEALGAEKFNTDLWKFLGRKDISLVPQTKGGYVIERNNDPNTKGQFLSEGEKTAIAFVYFINKLKEQDNRINNSIIVVDDPISSFDSNNLFSSYSYLKLNCNEAKQLFVLTHNFNYFRLVRDWFNAKNKKQKEKNIKDSSKPKSICNFYTLEVQLNKKNIRYSEIRNADETLLKYSSEYHYQFKKLIDYSSEVKVDLDKAYLTANAARKTLETFLKFKYPKKVNDFRQLFEKSIKNTTLKEKEEYIYKFINKYSHAQDFDNDSSDNQLDEGINVAKDVLNLIKEIDETHFEEMAEVCAN